MKLRAMAIFILTANILAGACVAAAQNPPPAAVAPGDRQAEGGPGGPGWRPDDDRVFSRAELVPGTAPLGMMQMMGPAMGREGRAGGPLQKISRLLAALDDPRIRVALGLTEQQAASLRKTVVDMETFTIKSGADIAVDSIELREMLRSDKPDRAAVMAKGDDISKLTAQLISHSLDAMLSAKTILTPEQQKMVRAYVEGGGRALPPLPAPAGPRNSPARP